VSNSHYHQLSNTDRLGIPCTSIRSPYSNLVVLHKDIVPYLLTHLLQVSTVELVHTHEDMMIPARNITSRCNCSMERLGRESIRQWFWSILPLLNTRQLNNMEKLLMVEHIFISPIRPEKITKVILDIKKPYYSEAINKSLREEIIPC